MHNEKCPYCNKTIEVSYGEQKCSFCHKRINVFPDSDMIIRKVVGLGVKELLATIFRK